MQHCQAELQVSSKVSGIPCKGEVCEEGEYTYVGPLKSREVKEEEVKYHKERQQVYPVKVC